jgi:hypothetical protein
VGEHRDDRDRDAAADGEPTPPAGHEQREELRERQQRRDGEREVVVPGVGEDDSSCLPTNGLICVMYDSAARAYRGRCESGAGANPATAHPCGR